MVGRVHKVHERVFSFCVGTHKYLVLWIVFVPKMIPTHQHIYTLTHTDTQFIFMLTLKWECHLVCRFVFISLFNLVLLLVLRGHREKERVRERESSLPSLLLSTSDLYIRIHLYQMKSFRFCCCCCCWNSSCFIVRFIFVRFVYFP